MWENDHEAFVTKPENILDIIIQCYTIYVD